MKQENRIYFFYQQIQKLLQKRKHLHVPEICSTEQNPIPHNDVIPYFRSVLEKLLELRGENYREIQLAVWDTAISKADQMDFADDLEKEETQFEQNWRIEEQRAYIDAQIFEVLFQLLPGLNHLSIYTDRPEIFSAYTNQAEEEYGLLAGVLTKNQIYAKSGMVLLDFEIEPNLPEYFLRDGILYLPIYRKQWQIGENLDITVPIGYNTVIVKGAIKRKAASYPDRFEREFYGK